MSKLTSLQTSLLTCALLACSKDGEVEKIDTGTSAQSVELNEIVRADLLSSNMGLFWYTDLSADAEVLREAGTGFAFLSGEFAIWAKDSNGNDSEDSPNLNHCIHVTGSEKNNGVTTTSFELDDCFVGFGKNRRLKGEGLAHTMDQSLELEVDWNFVMGTNELSGTFHGDWENLNESTYPDARITLQALYKEGINAGRTLHITEGTVEISDNFEKPATYHFPAEDSEALGAQITWEDRSDHLSFGGSLINEDKRYSGAYRGSYTSVSGSTIALTDGSFSESENGDFNLSYAASHQDENREITLTGVNQTWGSMTGDFVGDVSLDYTGSTHVNLGDWETDVDIRAYTINPLVISGSEGKTSLAGPIEFSVMSLDERERKKEVWLFGSCDNLLQKRDDSIAGAGACTFQNAEGINFGLFFADQSPTDGWVLVENTSGEWLCKNMVSGEEQQLEDGTGVGVTCPN